MKKYTKEDHSLEEHVFESLIMLVGFYWEEFASREEQLLSAKKADIMNRDSKFVLEVISEVYPVTLNE